VNSLLLLVLACLRRLRTYVVFFSIFCKSVYPAFTVSEFDRVGGLGFAFDGFCVTLLFHASQRFFGFKLLALPSVALFFD